ncbi:MAG: hypothetical protein CK548_09345 [Opitutia bacterium]|nr:MAG: hypothetical protein CK548_09345 [Opitutae bacterium]
MSLAISASSTGDAGAPRLPFWVFAGAAAAGVAAAGAGAVGAEQWRGDGEESEQGGAERARFIFWEHGDEGMAYEFLAQRWPDSMGNGRHCHRTAEGIHE